MLDSLACAVRKPRLLFCHSGERQRRDEESCSQAEGVPRFFAALRMTAFGDILRRLWDVQSFAAIALAILVAVAIAGCKRDTGTTEKKTPGGAEADKGGEQSVYFQLDQFGAPLILDDGRLTLKSLEGKVVLLDFFGTWCPTSRKSAPVLVSLYMRWHAAGLEVVGLAYERVSDPAQADSSLRAFRDEFGIPYPLAKGPSDLLEEISKKSKLEVNVETFLLVDKQGSVRYLFPGFRPGDEDLIEKRIEELLAEPALVSEENH
jgi:thiol-disulfide isomerase/thioredoxin